MEYLSQTVVALIAAVGAYFAAKANSEAKQANKAVNHTDPGSTRLYDLAAKTHSELSEVRARQKVIQDVLMSRPCIARNQCDVEGVQGGE